MKKPGGQGNEPTTLQWKPPSKEVDPSLGEDQKEEDQKEDVGEEEQEEENKEEDPEVEVDSTKLPVLSCSRRRTVRTRKKCRAASMT